MPQDAVFGGSMPTMATVKLGSKSFCQNYKDHSTFFEYYYTKRSFHKKKFMKKRKDQFAKNSGFKFSSFRVLALRLTFKFSNKTTDCKSPAL